MNKPIHHSDISAILNCLQQGEDLLLITILSREGSTPRPPGTSMLISSAGKQSGTIGGGQVEARAVLAAREAMKKGESLILHFDSEPDQGKSPDMMCGGSLDVLLEYMPAAPYYLQLWQNALNFYKKNKAIYMCMPLPGDTHTKNSQRFFLNEDGKLYGSCSGLEVDGLWKTVQQLQQAGVVNEQGVALMVLPCTVPAVLNIFGAGHVAGELAPLAVHLGFEVSVLDDRQEYLDQEAFQDTQRLLLPTFQNCFQSLQTDESSYLVIMTRGHQHDQEVLAQALRTSAGFIGMMGSRRKRDTLFQSLLEKGYLAEELQKVSCPVGLDIGADTPAEIAVSIMAQIIQHRFQKKDVR